MTKWCFSAVLSLALAGAASSQAAEAADDTSRKLLKDIWVNVASLQRRLVTDVHNASSAPFVATGLVLDLEHPESASCGPFRWARRFDIAFQHADATVKIDEHNAQGRHEMALRPPVVIAAGESARLTVSVSLVDWDKRRPHCEINFDIRGGLGVLGQDNSRSGTDDFRAYIVVLGDEQAFYPVK